MKKEVMTKWVEALRSGEYEQGYARLRQAGGDDGLFCVLGVLCQLHKEETHSAYWRHLCLHDCWAYGRVNIRPGDRDVSAECLPSCVMEWAGIRSPVGRIDDEICLSGMNDDGVPFDALADTIEQRWESL